MVATSDRAISTRQRDTGSPSSQPGRLEAALLAQGLKGKTKRGRGEKGKPPQGAEGRERAREKDHKENIAQGKGAYTGENGPRPQASRAAPEQSARNEEDGTPAADVIFPTSVRGVWDAPGGDWTERNGTSRGAQVMISS